MPALRNTGFAAPVETSFNCRLDHLRRSAGNDRNLFLDRTFNQRGRARLSGVQSAADTIIYGQNRKRERAASAIGANRALTLAVLTD